METKKKNIVDCFVGGARSGLDICLHSTIPNVIFAFVLIQILNLTGLTDIIGTICKPLMVLFGLPGIAATVLVASLLSIGGGVGVAASLVTSGQLNNQHIAILLPAIFLMGALFQYMGRILGTAELKKKYYAPLFVIAILNAMLAMLVMRILLLFL